MFRDRLVAFVATGTTTSVAFADGIQTGDLEALGSLVETWHKDGLDTPLLMTPHEFHRSLDTFPLEYQSIIDRHVVIAGDPPFTGVSVPVDQLRRACEVQAKGHLIHLRQGWLEAAGHGERLQRLAAQSAGPLRLLLMNVARLDRTAPTTGADPAQAGATLAGLPGALIERILKLEDATDRPAVTADDMREYLAASEKLWAFVDAWHGR